MRILSILLATTFFAASSQAANLTIDEQTVNFGEKYQFSVVTHDVRVWNRSGTAITFRDSQVPPGVTVQPEKGTLAGGDSTVLHIKADLRNAWGAIAAPLPVETTEGANSEHYQIVLEGFVDSVLDEGKPALDFGTVEAAAPKEKSIQLTSASNPDVRITRVIEAPDFVSVRIGDDAQTLLLTPKKFDVLGYSKGIVKVALDSPQQPQAWVTVLMDIHGNVVPDQNPVKFGLQRASTTKPVRLQMTSRNGKALHIDKVSVPGAGQLAVESAPCLPERRADCQAYMIGIKPGHAFGLLQDKVSFELPDTHQVLNVDVGGIYLDDSTKVHSLNDELASGGAQSSAPHADLQTSLKRAVAEKPETPTPAGQGPLLKWQVANESDIYGYAIYRGDSADGKFTRANEQIVRAENGGNNITATYQWRDNSAQKGREYWYYITIFNNSGRKTQLTGPQKVVAK